MANHIKEIQLLNTGGGCMVDYLILESGKVIGINDECVVGYHCEDDGYGPEFFEDSQAGIIYLEEQHQVEADYGESEFVYSINSDILMDEGKATPVDVVRLKDGNVVVVSEDKVMLYRSAVLTPNNRNDEYSIDLGKIVDPKNAQDSSPR